MPTPAGCTPTFGAFSSEFSDEFDRAYYVCIGFQGLVGDIFPVGLKASDVFISGSTNSAVFNPGQKETDVYLPGTKLEIFTPGIKTAEVSK